MAQSATMARLWHTGVVSLTMRRKKATALEIAEAAGSLFVQHGVAGTTVEAIADRAGVGVRTFYRYFPTKQAAVAPLLAFGAGRWQELLARALNEAPPKCPLAEILERATREALVGPGATDAVSFELIRLLLTTAASDPALRAVWLAVNDASEDCLAGVLSGSELGGAALASTHQARLLAASVTTGIRVSVEAWAVAGDPAEPHQLADDASRVVATIAVAVLAM